MYRSNFGVKGHVEGNIADYIDQIPKHDLLTGGFPCQPFSSAGKKLGLEDSRGTLFEKIIHILSKNKPKYFVLENVKRLLSMDKGTHFATILNALSNIGYLVEWRLLNAINFGLPQNRERIVIIGHLEQSPRSYLCTEDDFFELTDRQLSNIVHFERWKKIENHAAKFLNWGMALDGQFCHVKINQFSEKKPDVKLNSVLEKYPDDRFFFTEDTKERIKSSEEVNRFFNNVEILSA